LCSDQRTPNEEDISVKPKLAMFWASSCGGCEIALVNIHEHILQVDAAFDFIFCPCLLDGKKKDVEALPDNGIDITLFNGAIRTEENEEMAHLLRKKSRLLIAFGSCSSRGCIPGLSNLSSVAAHMRTMYLENPSTPNAAGILPRQTIEVPEGTLHLPAFYERVKTLAQVTDVDYYIPGCPPEPHQIWNIIESILQGAALPPKGSTLGGGVSSVCDECKRVKTDKKVARFVRTFEVIPDRERCLLEQGILCMGVATRDGCGGLCPEVNMPCIGCYGPPEGVADQGAKMIGALGSILDIGDIQHLSEEEINRHVDEAIASLPDPAGTFYKFSLPGSIIGGNVS
jgi:F420-non-reducing hydrogenase small subunit